jgi:hypothetical protein
MTETPERKPRPSHVAMDFIPAVALALHRGQRLNFRHRPPMLSGMLRDHLERLVAHPELRTRPLASETLGVVGVAIFELGMDPDAVTAPGADAAVAEVLRWCGDYRAALRTGDEAEALRLADTLGPTLAAQVRRAVPRPRPAGQSRR